MKSAREVRGLFRGSEFPKLILLAGVAIVGWALFIKFYKSSKSNAKVVSPAIANQPKLPPPDPTLQGIIDRTPLGVRDEAPMAMLFDRMRKDPAKLAAEARREVVPYDLWKTPKRYRGLPIRLEGYATQVYAHDDFDPSIAASGRVYEVWFVQEEHEERMYPCILFVDDVPATLPGGRDLRERVAFEGYFLKMYHFKRMDGKDYLAPMLVGRIAHVPNVGEQTTAWITFCEWLWPRRWSVVPIAALVYVSMRIAFRLLGKRRRTPIRSFLQPTDSIDHADLERWVDDAGVGDQKGDATKR